ncbi:MAG: hypothetical protein V3R89_01565, partial [Thermoanaerobaculia bacterium]
MPRRAHLGVEAVGFAEAALVGGVVVEEPGQFLLFTAGRNTLEWAWNLVDQSILVAYLDYNQVRYLGLISP